MGWVRAGGSKVVTYQRDVPALATDLLAGKRGTRIVASWEGGSAEVRGPVNHGYPGHSQTGTGREKNVAGWTKKKMRGLYNSVMWREGP